MQIKIRGHRINLREIEQVLEEVPSIDDVSVTTCPCRSGSIVVAFYTTNTRSFPTRKILLRSIKKRLPSYMLPILVRLEAIPLQPQTGKASIYHTFALSSKFRGSTFQYFVAQYLKDLFPNVSVFILGINKVCLMQSIIIFGVYVQQFMQVM